MSWFCMQVLQNYMYMYSQKSGLHFLKIFEDIYISPEGKPALSLK